MIGAVLIYERRVTVPKTSDKAWLEGKTDSGRTVHIDMDPYVNSGDAVVTIDGELANMTSCTRYRDGGTTKIETLGGVVVYASPLRPSTKHTLDGEELCLAACHDEGDR